MIHVCFAFDESMALGAYAAGASAIAATSTPLTVHFITDRPAGLVERCANLLRRQGAEVVTHFVGDKVADLKCNDDFPLPVFYRLAIQDLIDAPRAIYLDSDIVVARDLSELMAVPLDGHPLAAAIDWALYLALNDRIPYAGGTHILSNYLRDVIGSDPASRRYFNSGVLVMDLDQWRKRDLATRVMDLVRSREHPFRWADQCALNAIIGEDYKILDPRWNAHVGWTSDYEDLATCTEPWWREVKSLWARDPWIVHFAGRYKPWITGHRRTGFDHLFREATRRFPAAELEPLLRALNKSPLDYVASLDEGIAFARPGKPLFATSMHGFSHVEDWGRWTVCREARIEFLAPLPDHFVVELVGQSFGPNADHEFGIEAGKFRSALTVRANGLQTYRTEVSNPERSKVLTITIPQPTSPRSLGLSDDPRPLGLGLASLKIKPVGLPSRLRKASGRLIGALKPARPAGR